MLNSLCDGSGGYIGSFNESTLIIGHSMIKTQVSARDQSVLLGLFSSFTDMKINADESAIMLIANTLRLADQRAHSKAAIIASCGTVPMHKIERCLPVSITAGCTATALFVSSNWS
ncbi:hypothetical protein GF407_03495 [candidate division KSB1 bacterium]|nr:hypothetical protein [candidate division KSB1 bacterium]